MLTTDELKAIQLFSALEVKDLEHLVRTCEDVHLRASEFAVHEGGERALFAVLAAGPGLHHATKTVRCC